MGVDSISPNQTTSSIKDPIMFAGHHLINQRWNEVMRLYIYDFIQSLQVGLNIPTQALGMHLTMDIFTFHTMALPMTRAGCSGSVWRRWAGNVFDPLSACWWTIGTPFELCLLPTVIQLSCWAGSVGGVTSCWLFTMLACVLTLLPSSFSGSLSLVTNTANAKRVKGESNHLTHSVANRRIKGRS